MDNSKITSFIPKSSNTPNNNLAGIGGSMANKFPKQSTSVSATGNYRSKFAGAYNLLGVVSFALLALSLVFTAGAYVYRLYLFDKVYGACQEDGGSCGLAESLKRDRQNLGTETLIRAKRLEVKTSNGQALLNQHIVVSPLFRQIFNALTIEGISYEQFDFNDKGVTISGKARSYEDIAYQAEVFGSKDAKGKVQSFNFYDLDLDEKGNVIFKLDLVPDRSNLSFSRLPL